MESESSLLKRLKVRCPTPAWAVFDHVRNQTGFRKSRTRTADAIALSLFPSNGLSLHGFEMKCSKSDLMKELKDPTKSAEFSEYCHHWWIVVSDLGCVEGLEIPPNWGILFPHKNSLKAWRSAPVLNPKPMDINFVCAIARKMDEVIQSRLKGMIPEADIESVIQERIAKAVETQRKQDAFRLRNLERMIQDFERQSGTSLNAYNSGQIASVVKLVNRLGQSGVRDYVQAELSRSREHAAILEQFLLKNPQSESSLKHE